MSVEQLTRGSVAAGEYIPRPEHCLTDEQRLTEQREREQWERIMRLPKILNFFDAKSADSRTEDLHQGEGVCDADASPTPSFGLQPEIQDESDLVLAMQWLSWGASRIATVNAYMEQIIRLARDTAAQDLQIVVEDEPASLEEHLRLIEQAVIQYADEHRDELFANRKTAKFSAGEIKLAKKPLSVICEPDRETVLEKILDELEEAEQTVIGSLRTLLAPFVSIKFTLDVEGIKRAVKDGRLDEDALAEHGLKTETGERISAKPYDYSQRQVA